MSKTLSLATIALAVISISLLTWGGIGLNKHLIIAVDKWGDTGAQMTATVKHLNAPGGTLTMADEDLGAAKSVIIHGDIVFKHEEKQLGKIDGYVATIYDDLHGVLGQTHTDLVTLDGTLAGATTLEGQATTTIKLANGRLSDPRVDQLISHLESTAGHVDGMSASGDQIGKDTAAKIHSILHPDIKKMTLLGGIDATVLWIHSHLMPPIF